MRSQPQTVQVSTEPASLLLRAFVLECKRRRSLIQIDVSVSTSAGNRSQLGLREKLTPYTRPGTALSFDVENLLLASKFFWREKSGVISSTAAAGLEARKPATLKKHDPFVNSELILQPNFHTTLVTRRTFANVGKQVGDIIPRVPVQASL